jgi:D-glycerate 3-kinase
VGADWLDEFLAAEALPAGFRATVDEVCRPLAARAERLRQERAATVVVGLCGAQGSGKSTIAAATAGLVAARGLSASVLSLDDVYLGRAERLRLASRVHPLLSTRGPPGTHDVALACRTLDALSRPGAVALPAFDKGRDARRPQVDWRRVEAPVDVVLFEGWCVGARPQPQAALAEPVNRLERDEDPDGTWRRFVNAELAEAYAGLFARLDALVLLAAPNFEVVAGWRAEQEAKLRARTGLGMSEAEIDRFVAHYERLTRWILDEAPARADWVVRLDAERRPLAVA